MSPQENRHIQNMGHSAGQLTQFLKPVNGVEKEVEGVWLGTVLH
jgi:predicted double-glycine peptidase